MGGCRGMRGPTLNDRGLADVTAGSATEARAGRSREISSRGVHLRQAGNGGRASGCRSGPTRRPSPGEQRPGPGVGCTSRAECEVRPAGGSHGGRDPPTAPGRGASPRKVPRGPAGLLAPGRSVPGRPSLINERCGPGWGAASRLLPSRGPGAMHEYRGTPGFVRLTSPRVAAGVGHPRSNPRFVVLGALLEAMERGPCLGVMDACALPPWW